MRQSPLKAKTPLRTNGRLRSRAKPKRQPQPTLTKLRKEADDWFSWYVRLRDSRWQDDGWYGKCITCSKDALVAYLDYETAKRRPTGAIRFARDWDGGHFVSRGNLIVRFEEENDNLQCKFHCNNMKSGNRDKYRVALRDKYGDGVPEKLEKLADDNLNYRFSRQELEQVITDAKEQVAFYEKDRS